MVAGSDEILVASYEPAWREIFAGLAAQLRRELGSVALRIDHIGSTAVPGLDAKPIIDVQISVASLEPVEPFRGPLERCGFIWRADNPERTKRYFRERPGARRTHLHVRRQGSFSEQLNLLFRDYLRNHAEWAREYAAEKHRLAYLLESDRQAYVDAKAPFVWETIRRADAWAQVTGWEPGPSDA